jgi:ketosteroid isomerase-like protein
MSDQENLTVVEELFDAFNAHDAERLAKLYLESGVVHRSVTNPPLEGHESIGAWFNAIFEYYPDCKWSRRRTFGQDDLICVEWVFNGSHKDHPTKPIQTWDCAVLQINSGKIAEARIYYDRLSAQEQLE